MCFGALLKELKGLQVQHYCTMNSNIYVDQQRKKSIVGIVSKETGAALALALQFHSLRRRANAQNISTSFLPYGGITYFINSFDYPYLKEKSNSIIVIVMRSMVGAVDKRLPPTTVTRVRFLYLLSNVG